MGRAILADVGASGPQEENDPADRDEERLRTECATQQCGSGRAQATASEGAAHAGRCCVPTPRPVGLIAAGGLSRHSSKRRSPTTRGTTTGTRFAHGWQWPEYQRKRFKSGRAQDNHDGRPLCTPFARGYGVSVRTAGDVIVMNMTFSITGASAFRNLDNVVVGGAIS